MRPALLTVSLKGPQGGPLGEYVVQADPASLDAFVAEVQSHGHIYDATWRWHPVDRPIEDRAASFDVIRRELFWLFED